jgi:ABC-type dipeptide/oligopeptide/nickel transport system ATPase component
MTGMPRIARDGRVLIVGTTGSGKSRIGLAIFALSMGPPLHSRRVLVDPQDVYRLVLERGACEAHDPSAIDWSAHTIRLAFGDDADAYEEAFATINRTTDTAVMIDEAEAVWDGRRRSALRTMYTGGRKLGNMIVACNQHCTQIETAMSSQTEMIISCSLDRMADIAWVAAEAGMQPAELAAQMDELPPRELPDGDVRRSVHSLWIDKLRKTRTWRDALPASWLTETDRVVTTLR